MLDNGIYWFKYFLNCSQSDIHMDILKTRMTSYVEYALEYSRKKGGRDKMKQKEG